jgi:elongation factor G
MTQPATGDVRNLAFIGGPGSGKTSLVEALLFKAGAIQRLGAVADGTTPPTGTPRRRRSSTAAS